MSLVLAEKVGFEPTCPCGQPHFECGSLWPLRYFSMTIIIYHRIRRFARCVFAFQIKIKMLRQLQARGRRWSKPKQLWKSESCAKIYLLIYGGFISSAVIRHKEKAIGETWDYIETLPPKEYKKEDKDDRDHIDIHTYSSYRRSGRMYHFSDVKQKKYHQEDIGYG